MKYSLFMKASYTLLLSALLMSSLNAISQEKPEAKEIDPTRFEKSIEAFAAKDALSPPPEGAIVLTGSSSIARWNDQAQGALSPLTVIPRGFGGSVMGDVLYYLDQVALKYKPRAILIYEGDNDTGPYKVPDDVIVSQLDEIIARVRVELPNTRIYVLSVKPSVSRWNVWPIAQRVSRKFRTVAEANANVYYVDVASPLLNADGSVKTDIFIQDNLHLNHKGNAIWGATIKSALMQIEAQYE